MKIINEMNIFKNINQNYYYSRVKYIYINLTTFIEVIYCIHRLYI